MISHRLQSAPVTGYYQYLSQIRHRVNVTPNERTDSEETMTKTASTTLSVDVATDSSNEEFATNSSSVNNVQQTASNLKDNDVTKWSSTDVQHWIEEQCQKFELKKTTAEKFQMNGKIFPLKRQHLTIYTFTFYLGQALVLLTKNDFVRRSPDGGEIFYYALRRLIGKFLIVYTPHSLFVINKTN